MRCKESLYVYDILCVNVFHTTYLRNQFSFCFSNTVQNVPIITNLTENLITSSFCISVRLILVLHGVTKWLYRSLIDLLYVITYRYKYVTYLYKYISITDQEV